MRWTNDLDVVNLLSSVIDSKFEKYEYNLARYLNKADLDLKNYSEYSLAPSIGFSSLYVDDDILKPSSSNVVKSVIDSLVSKLANNKTRPYFTPVNGTYETRETVKAVQSYFDTFYDNNDIHSKIAKAFKEACIFDIGYIWVNPFTWSVEVADTWTVGLLNSEKTNTKMLIKIDNYPTTNLPSYKGTEDYVQYAVYVDTISHKAIEYANGNETQKIDYNADMLPIVKVYFNEPVNGMKTVSVVDELDGIQTQIDLINAKIAQASQLTPANTTYIYEQNSLKAGELTNRTGQIYQIDSPPGMTSLPVQTITPAVFDPQWLNLLDYYKGLAYEMIGISQLSAQSKKPSGLNSGTALATMEDIESDRFETQTTHYVNAYINLAKMIIAVAPENADILPKDLNVSSLKWKDVKKQSKLFKIQYSAATALSKDPAEKVKQVMQLSQVGLIGASKISQYLDMPDLEDAYRGASAVQDGIDKVIHNAIYDEIYEIPEYVNYQQLAQNIAMQQNILFSIRDNKDAERGLERLNILDQHLQDIMTENGYIDLTPDEDDQGKQSDSGLAVNSLNQQVQAQGSDMDISPMDVEETLEGKSKI